METNVKKRILQTITYSVALLVLVIYFMSVHKLKGDPYTPEPDIFSALWSVV